MNSIIKPKNGLFKAAQRIENDLKYKHITVPARLMSLAVYGVAVTVSVVSFVIVKIAG